MTVRKDCPKHEKNQSNQGLGKSPQRTTRINVRGSTEATAPFKWKYYIKDQGNSSDSKNKYMIIRNFHILKVFPG